MYNILYEMNYTLFQKKYVNILGLIYITTEKEESMSPSINTNDLIFTIKIFNENIKENEIIGYDINDEITFHRVIKINKENNIKLYETKADNFYHNDLEYKTIKQIKGKIFLKIPLIGLAFRIFENKITTVVIIVAYLLKFSFNKYRHEKNYKLSKNENI